MRIRSLIWPLALLLTALGANAAPWVELAKPQPTQDPAKIEVIEFFWYGCPHCYYAEPAVAEWRKRQPAEVQFVRVPAIFNTNWAVLGRAYYAMQQLGLGEDVHRALFEAIHTDRKNLNDDASLTEFFATHGVPREKFADAYHSFGVDSQTGRANQMTRAYGLEGVPTFIVNGKFRVDGTSAGSEAGMFEALDQLVAQELKTAK